MANPTSITVNLNGKQYTLYDDNQFHDSSGTPTGIYVTGDGRLTDSSGTTNYGSWDAAGNVIITDPNTGKSVQGKWNNSSTKGNGGSTNTFTPTQITWQPNNAYESMAFNWKGNKCDWTLLNNNTVIDNTSGKQVGTWDRQYGLHVTMPDGRVHHINWKANGQIDVTGDNLGSFAPTIVDLSNIKGYALDENGNKSLVFYKDGSIKDQGNNLVGKYNTNKDGRLAISFADGTSAGIYDPKAGTYYPKGITPPPKKDAGLLRGYGGQQESGLVGTVTSYDKDGNKKTLSLTSGGGILDENNKPVGTYSSSAPGQFDLKTLDNKPSGSYNANTGVLTTADKKTTINAGFTPGPAANFMPYTPPPKGELTPIPEYKPGLLTPMPEYKPISPNFKGYTPPKVENPTPWKPNYELMTGRTK